MKLNKITFLLLFPLYCLAQEIPEYYSSINFELTGNALKNELADLITETHTNELVYTPEVWEALKQSDLDPNNSENVLLLYGYEDNDSDPDNDRTRDKDLSCHNTSCEGKWVREHVYPRSLGNPNLEYTGPGSDAHHLRSIDYYMNSSRSNRRFADGEGHATTLDGWLFYPGDEWKGDVARMMMYMYVRYDDRCLATTVGAGSTTYSSDMPNIFLEWNEEDPVSQYEINRNEVLEDMQGNRNPFIDNPYLATLIWNGPTAEDKWALNSTNEITQKKFIIYPTVTDGIIYIENNSNSNYSCSVYNMVGQKIKTTISDNYINIKGNPKGIYFLNITTGNKRENFKILLK